MKIEKGEKSFSQVLKERRSIRKFKKVEIQDSNVESILQACDSAPSAGGLQSLEIYKINGSEVKDKLVRAASDQEYIAEAPTVLVFCANAKHSEGKYGKRSKLFAIQDATIAAAYAQLTACAIGLSSVWIGAFDEEKVASILKLPKEHKPIAILPIGYPNQQPVGKTTRGKEMVHTLI